FDVVHAVGVGDGGLRGGGGDVDGHRDRTGGAQVGLVNLQVAYARRNAGGDEVEAAIQQAAALELRDLGDTVDGFQRGVDLQLVGGDLLVAQRAGVGGFGHQAADVVEQRADLPQRAVGGCNELIGPLAVGD